MISIAVSTADTLPRYPVRMASKVILWSFQCRHTVFIAPSRWNTAGLPNPPVWVDSRAVGRMQVSCPQAERMGMATVMEH